MRSQLLFLFLLFISMYTFGQTGSSKPRPVTEYFNYKTLDQVFDTLINKFDFKITYDQAEVNKSRFSYSSVSYTHLFYLFTTAGKMTFTFSPCMSWLCTGISSWISRPHAFSSGIFFSLSGKAVIRDPRFNTLPVRE